MRYVCFVYENAEAMAARSEAEEKAITREHLDYDDWLRANGHFVDAAALQQPSASKVVRLRGGEVSVTDGPFAETKEHIGGFIFIEAPSLEKAIEIAGGIPSARFSVIELRPTRNLIEEIGGGS